jgi:hypothetical protein
LNFNPDFAFAVWDLCALRSAFAIWTKWKIEVTGPRIKRLPKKRTSFNYYRKYGILYIVYVNG